MNRIALLIACALLLPVSSLAQKAYEAVIYSGTAQNLNIRLTYADGYIGASEIKTIDTKTKKTSRFLPESGVVSDGNKLSFSHYSAKDPEKKFSDHFVLDGMEDQSGVLPRKIYGKYYLNNKVCPVVLIRQGR